MATAVAPGLEQLEQTILALVAARGPDKSICPSEVARLLAPGPGEAWRTLMVPVRRAAIGLARGGRVDVLRKGRPVPPDSAADVKGVIRLRLRRPEGQEP